MTNPSVKRAHKALVRLLPVSKFDGVLVAGGAVRDFLMGKSEPVHDVDVFFTSQRAFDRVRLSLKTRGAVDLTDADKKLSVNFQGLKYDLIRELWEDAGELSRNADLTVASGVIEMKGGELDCHQLFWSDLAARSIRLAPEHGGKLANPVKTLPRVIRYVEMGFHADYSEMMRLSYHVARSDVDGPKLFDF